MSTEVAVDEEVGELVQLLNIVETPSASESTLIHDPDMTKEREWPSAAPENGKTTASWWKQRGMGSKRRAWAGGDQHHC